MKKKPEARTGLPVNTAIGCGPVREDPAASHTDSGTPEASSAMMSVHVECKPWRASGCSARAVLILMKDSAGRSTNSAESALISTILRMVFGSRWPHASNSAQSASKSCFSDGAVTPVFCGKRQSRWCHIIQASQVLLPTPWPDRMAIRGSRR